MPSRHYRRRILNTKNTHSYISIKYSVKNNINNIISNTNNDKKSLLITVQQHFLDIIDTIIYFIEPMIAYSYMNIAIQQINSLITIISSKEDIYKLLDTIENTVLSIIKNIADGESIGIIDERITYLRELLDVYPDTCDTYTYFGNLIYPIIESITNGIDFNIIINNITQIQSLFNTDVQLLNTIHIIQDTILSIIQNIANGESIGIINDRINYLSTLINTIVC